MSLKLRDLPPVTGSNFLERVREVIHTWMGKSGDSSAKLVTVGDLEDAGLVEVVGPASSTTLIPGPAVSTAEEPDLTVPPTPTGLTITAGITRLIVQTDTPSYTAGHGHDRTVLYGATYSGSGPLPTFADAVQLKTFLGAITDVTTNPNTEWHLWVKWQTVDGVLSAPAGGTNGATATTGKVGTTDLNDLIITSQKLAAGSINALAKFGSGLEPVYNVAVLPSAAGYTGPSTVLNQADGKIYRYASGAWTSAVPTTDLSGQITTTQITNNAVTTGKIAANAVTATEIATDAVTANKIQAGAVVAGKIATAAIVAGDGVIANAAITNALIANLAVDSAKIADASIVTAKIADANITTAKIATAAITTALIADANITTAKIVDAAITTAKIADANITTAKIAAAAITNALIANATITNAKILDGEITASKIAAGTITTDRLVANAATVATSAVVVSRTGSYASGATQTVITGDTLTLACTGNRVKWIGSVHLALEGGQTNTDMCSIKVEYLLDGTSVWAWLGKYKPILTYGPFNFNLYMPIPLGYFSTPAAGSHTFQFQITAQFLNANTATAANASGGWTTSSSFLVEENKV